MTGNWDCEWFTSDGTPPFNNKHTARFPVRPALPISPTPIHGCEHTPPGRRDSCHPPCLPRPRTLRHGRGVSAGGDA